MPSSYLQPIQFLDAFLCVFPQNFRHSSTMSDSKSFAKIILINSLGGATVTRAAYTAF